MPPGQAVTVFQALAGRRRRATAIASTPPHAGQKRRLLNTSVDALRHGSAGAIAIMNSRAMPIGVPSWSKYGEPTTILRVLIASTSSA